MKTKFTLTAAFVSLCIFLSAGIAGCNGGGGGGTGVTGSCKAKKGYSDGLWNCDKSDCTGKCMLQVRHITPATPGDTVWRDIPGGNVNDDDLKEQKQEVRCDCR